MHKQILTLIFLVLLSFLITSGIDAAQSDSAFTFRLAFLKSEKKGYKEMNFSRPVKMSDGEKFKIYIDTDKTAYLYLINKNPDGKAAVMYRSSINTVKHLCLPSDTNSYTIEPPQGTDTIYMVISVNPQVKLEGILDALKIREGNSEQKAQAVFDEINRIKQEVSGYNTDPSKPVPIGGTERGTNCSAAKFTATEFSGRNIYVKTIRVSH